MSILVSLLDANLKLHAHAASALEKALRQQALTPYKRAFDEQAYLQAYLALRDVEAQELRLLSETAKLAQLLRREENARRTEQKLDETLHAQDTGNGKKAAILSQEALLKQTEAVKKDHRLVYKNAEEIVGIFLAQHEAFARADWLFKALDPNLALLHRRAEDAILKTYARAGDSAQKLRELVREEVEQGHPLELAAALEAHRRKMRQHLTRLTEARRHFAAFLQQRLPMIGAL